MIKIAPSILAANLGCLKEEVIKIEQAGADMIHIDIINGHFAPNITFGTEIVKVIKKSGRLPLDLHLMISKPEKHVKSFLNAGGDVVSVHSEACNTSILKRIIHEVRKYGAKVGVALKPETEFPVKAYGLLDQLDTVLIMSVPPGFCGQKFDPRVIPKIAKLKAIIQKRGLPIDIEVDGGINPTNAPLVAKAGATILVSGGYIFSKANIGDAIRELRKQILDHGRGKLAPAKT